MANNPTRSYEAANAAANAQTALLNGGVLRFYTGAQPANPDTAITTQTLLAELTIPNPAFAAAVNGVATANTITGDASANASGTAAWFRAFKTGGAVAVLDGTVGTSLADCNLSTTAILAGQPVEVTSWTWTERRTA